MRRELEPEDREKIVRAVATGDRVEATNIYISITGKGLTEEQTFIKTLTAELKSTDQAKQTAKQLRSCERSRDRPIPTSFTAS